MFSTFLFLNDFGFQILTNRFVKGHPCLLVKVYIETVWKQFLKITLSPMFPIIFIMASCSNYNFWHFSLWTFLLSRAITLSLVLFTVFCSIAWWLCALILEPVCLDSFPALQLISCVALGKVLNLCTLVSLSVKWGIQSTSVIGLLWSVCVCVCVLWG